MRGVPEWLGAIAAVLAFFFGWRPQRDEPVSIVRDEDLCVHAQSRVLRAVENFAMQDWLVVFYLVALLIGVLVGDGPRERAIVWLVIDLCAVLTCLVVARGDFVRSPVARSLVYRGVFFVAVLGSFLQFQYILPTAASRAVDGRIYALDHRVFGFEPAEVWDRYVTPATTEWFSFFYYSYFALIALHVLPMVLFEKRMRVLSEFSWGILFIFSVGQVLYLVVPGYGPYQFLEGRFEHQLAGGLWWPLVKSAVDSVDGAARLDIFPSLHTAMPTFLALFSFRNRAHRPFRYTWPILAVFASQIVLATMFLRWHYLADICAGLVLATVGAASARWVAESEAPQRAKYGASPVWTPLFGSATTSMAEEDGPRD